MANYKYKSPLKYQFDIQQRAGKHLYEEVDKTLEFLGYLQSPDSGLDLTDKAQKDLADIKKQYDALMQKVVKLEKLHKQLNDINMKLAVTTFDRINLGVDLNSLWDTYFDTHKTMYD